MERTGDTEDDVTKLRIESFAGYALRFLYDDTNAIGVDVDEAALFTVIRAGIFDGYYKHREAEKTAAQADALRSTVRPSKYYEAASVAIALVQTYGAIVVSDVQPQLTDRATTLGAKTYYSWWAYHLALLIADIPQTDDGDPVGRPGRQIMSVLDAVPGSTPDHLEHQILPSLLNHLAAHRPATTPTAPSGGTTPADDTPAHPYSTADHATVTKPGTHIDNAGTPAAFPPTGTLTLTDRMMPPLRTALLAALAVLAVVACVWAGRQSVPSTQPTAETSPATITITAPPPVAPVETDDPATTDTYSPAVLSEISLQVLAFPERTKPDPTVQAVPDHPAQRPAVVAMGRSLTVQIRLTRTATAAHDPDEQFFLQFWSSAFLSVGDTYKTLPHQARAQVPGGLPAKSSTLINDADLDDTTPLLFEIEVAAAPLDGPPEESYNCGFNTTQAVHVLLSSAGHPLPRVVTTLPISVLRTDHC